MSDEPTLGATSPLAQTEETICTCAEEFQRIVDDAVSYSIPGLTFLALLKDAGAIMDEARDYINQYTQCRRSPETVAGLPPGQANPSTLNLINTATSITWALLYVKVDHFQGASP